jgi:uroporphyrinogen III methyltransferase/synthase
MIETAGKHIKNNKPLAGHMVLVTGLYKPGYWRIEELGGSIFAFPTIKTVLARDYSELDASIDSLGTYHWLVFTSASGVRYCMARMAKKVDILGALDGLKICAIGPKTAEAAAEYGLSVDLLPDEFNADGLIAAFLKDAQSRQDPRYKTSNLAGLRVLLPRAENARDRFPDRIIELGGEIDCPTAYRTVNPAKYSERLAALLKSGVITIATFTSSAAFHNFVEAMGDEVIDFLRGTVIAAIGPVTVAAIEAAGLKTLIKPKKATVESMIDEIISVATRKP